MKYIKINFIKDFFDNFDKIWGTHHSLTVYKDGREFCITKDSLILHEDNIIRAIVIFRYIKYCIIG